MRAEKVKVENLVQILKDNGAGQYDGINTSFVYPHEYVLNYKVPHKCNFCKKHYRSNEISTFDSQLVSVCTYCGGRHHMTAADITKKQTKTKRLRIVYAILIAIAAIFILSLSSSAAYNAEDESYDDVYSAYTVEAEDTPTVYFQ